MDRSNFLKRLYMRTLGKYRYRDLNLPEELYIKSEKPVKIVLTNNVTALTAGVCIDRYGIQDNLIIHEMEETEVFLNRIRHASVFYDVGAHVGYYSLMAAAHSNIKQVIAFEMLEVMARELAFHAKNNDLKNIRIETTPVGNGKETIAFGQMFDYKKDRSTSLDVFSKQSNIKPDYMKMDIEGFEYFALNGCTKLLADQTPELLLSLHPELILQHGGNVDTVMSMLKKYYPFIYRFRECSRMNMPLDHYLQELKKEIVPEKNCSLYCTSHPLL